MIETFGLSRRFKELTAVDDLNLNVETGEVVGLLGPNGAGKTTTIRMLAGIIAPTEGHAVVAGYRTDRNVEQLHEVIGMLTEMPGLYNRLSAWRNLEFFAGFYPSINAKLLVEKYLRRLGLWERRESKAGTFSKGLKQRLALARALVHEPKVLFLDEPTAGLDPEAAGEVREIIRELGSEGRTIFLSTHNLNEAELLCNRIAVINTRLLALGTPGQLRRRLFQRLIIVELQEQNPAIAHLVSKLDFVQDVREEGKRLILQLDDPERFRPELVRRIVEEGGNLLAVSEKQYPLEEVYLHLLHEDTDDDS
jgi:ABC-2 type transport system ATP-binding protein